MNVKCLLLLICRLFEVSLVKKYTILQVVCIILMVVFFIYQIGCHFRTLHHIFIMIFVCGKEVIRFQILQGESVCFVPCFLLTFLQIPYKLSIGRTYTLSKVRRRHG
ncbi:hypothetical protein EVA_16464 [gut metagenome]|uniref:Uncharacterized protein n=1 Tax=gut metagenome TaxID=749906 RepID=J9C6G1_9ZZZZ